MYQILQKIFQRIFALGGLALLFKYIINHKHLTLTFDRISFPYLSWSVSRDLELYVQQNRNQYYEKEQGRIYFACPQNECH